MAKKTSPLPPMQPDKISNYFQAYWRGEMSLWGAFWVWGMGVGTLVGLLFTTLSLLLWQQFMLLVYTGDWPMAILGGYMLLLVYGFWLTFYSWHVVSVWRCSAHSKLAVKLAARGFVGAVAVSYWLIHALNVWLRYL